MDRNKDKYRLLIENLPDAYAYHQIVVDENGKPVDYIFMDVNSAFEEMTDLKRQEIIGRKITEVLPGIENSEFDWIATYGRVALTGEAIRFESYSEPLQRWYDVSAYTDEPGFFAVAFHNTTSQKLLEKEIIENEKRYQSIVNTQQEMICHYLPDTTLIFVNEAYCRAFDKSEQELIGHKFLEHIPLDFQDELMKIISSLTLEKPSITQEHRALLVDGTICWQEWTDQAIFNVTGELVEYQAVGRDITDLVKSRQALQESYSILRLAAETAKFGGWSVDLKTGRAIWSDQVAIIHDMPVGYSPLVSEAISFYAPEWQSKIIEVVQDCIEKNIPFDEELEITTAKGRRVWVRVAGEAVKDDSNNIIAIHGAFQDIDDQKKIERALRQSEERLDLAMSVKNEGLWDWNLISNEAYFDDRYFTMAEYQPGDFPHNFVAWAERVHSEDLPVVQGAIEAYVSGVSNIFDVEFRFKRKNGEWMWINGKGRIYAKDKRGIPTRLIGTHTDITERKKAEAEIRKLNEELEERVRERTFQLEAANRELDAFSYSASHDLRGPLNRVSGFSEALLEDYEHLLDQQGKDYLKRINNACEQMKLLIDDLLALSRVSKMEINREPVELSALVNTYLKELQSREPLREVETAVSTGLIVDGDTALLRIALENLLDNAWKFSADEAAARVEFGSVERNGRRVYYIRDNGVGFDMKYSWKLFTAFHRIHDARDYPGTGIGLSIVSRIISRHDGEIWAESEPGKGATFFFTLP